MRVHPGVRLCAVCGHVGVDGAARLQVWGAAGASQEGAGPELVQPALPCRHQQVYVPLSFAPNFPSGLAAPGCCSIPHAEFQSCHPRGRTARERQCFLQKPLCCIGNPSLPARLNCSICAFRTLKIHSILLRPAWPAHSPGSWGQRPARCSPTAWAGDGGCASLP